MILICIMLRKRKEFRTRALEALRNGNMQEAFESFQKCCDITPEMAANVIQVGTSSMVLFICCKCVL